MGPIQAAIEAEQKLAEIAKTRRPTADESREALAAYAAAAKEQRRLARQATVSP